MGGIIPGVPGAGDLIEMSSTPCQITFFTGNRLKTSSTMEPDAIFTVHNQTVKFFVSKSRVPQELISPFATTHMPPCSYITIEDVRRLYPQAHYLQVVHCEPKTLAEMVFLRNMAVTLLASLRSSIEFDIVEDWVRQPTLVRVVKVELALKRLRVSINTRKKRQRGKKTSRPKKPNKTRKRWK